MSESVSVDSLIVLCVSSEYERMESRRRETVLMEVVLNFFDASWMVVERTVLVRASKRDESGVGDGREKRGIRVAVEEK